MTIDERLRRLGFILPDPLRAPAGSSYPFTWVRVRGNRAYLSGHLPLQLDGSLAEPFGKVGTDVSLEQGVAAARLAALAAIGSIQRELGDLAAFDLSGATSARVASGTPPRAKARPAHRGGGGRTPP
jgi:hypothetical protein